MSQLQWATLWLTDTAQRTEAIAGFILSLENSIRPSTSSSSLDDLHPDVAYALKRLIRGLSSGRDAARQGFAVGLTELLARLPDLPVAPVIELLLTNTEVTSSIKGEEGRDNHFGRLVGIEALLSSGLLLAPHATIQDLQTICKALVGLYDAKSYLKESAGSLAMDLIRALHQDATKQAAAKEILLASGRTATAESVAWSLSLGDNVIDEGRIESVVNVLKATHSIRSVEGQPHFVWKAIAATSPSSAIIERLTGQLLTRDATVTQRREGFLGLATLVRAPKQVSRSVFQLAVEASAKGKSVAPGMAIAAKKLLSKLYEVVRAHPNRTLETIISFVGEDGSGYFNALSQSKALEDIASLLPDSDRRRWMTLLRTIVVAPVGAAKDTEADDKSTTQLRRWALEQIASLGGSEGIECLAVHGFYTVVKESKKNAIEAARRSASPALPAVLQELCRARLYSLLVKDLAQMQSALATLAALAADKKHISPLFVDSEAVTLARQAASTMLSKLADTSDERSQAFSQLLRCIVIASHEEVTLATPISVLSIIWTEKSKDPVTFIDEFVAQLLVLLQQPQILVRPVVEEVFKSFAASITQSSLDMLIEMVAPDVLDDAVPSEDLMQDVTRTNGARDDADSDDEDSDVSLDSDEDLELDLGEVNEELRAKVEAALRDANIAEDGDGAESAKEEILDDEAMFALDEQLAAAFRSEAKAPSKKAAKVQDTNARLKVLDLLQLYVKALPTASSLPKVVAALHAACSDSELTLKASRLLSTVIGRKIKADEIDVDLSQQAALWLERVLLVSNKTTQTAAVFLLRLIKDDTAAATALSPALEAFTSQKRAPFTEPVLLSLAKARPAAVAPSIDTWVAASTASDLRPMRKRQLARISAALLQIIASSSQQIVWQHLASVLEILASTVDADGPADAAREQLKALAALLRLARNPAKLPVSTQDVDAICLKGRLSSQVEAEGAFGGSKPCRSLANEVQRLADPSSAPAPSPEKKRKRRDEAEKVVKKRKE